jgi:hypothetical protein
MERGQIEIAINNGNQHQHHHEATNRIYLFIHFIIERMKQNIIFLYFSTLQRYLSAHPRFTLILFTFISSILVLFGFASDLIVNIASYAYPAYKSIQLMKQITKQQQTTYKLQQEQIQW